VRAVESLATHHGVHEAVSVRIRKQIPVAGGLAGGSADAAAARHRLLIRIAGTAADVIPPTGRPGV